MTPKDNILHRRLLSGATTIANQNKRKLFSRLFRLSQDHIQNGQRQLVVFSFDFIGHHINLDGIFEKGELDTAFEWMAQRAEAFNGVAIDVGANIGNHSLYFSDFYRQVYSFEPNPRTFKVLQLNSELVSNITCFDVGISDQERAANLNIYANNIGHSDIASAHTTSTAAIKLKTLDSQIEPTAKVRLIKFDVEGHEYQAICGSHGIIEKNQPIILFEQLAEEIRNGTSDVIELLRSYGYSNFATVKQSTTRLSAQNKAINSLLSILNRLPIFKSVLFGTTWEVRLEEKFENINYPFIVAIPDWYIKHQNPTEG
jgi:FkbM family methyltransferase